MTALHSHRRPSFHELLVQALAKLWHGNHNVRTEPPKVVWPLNLTPPVVDPTPAHLLSGVGSFHAAVHLDPNHTCWYCSADAVSLCPASRTGSAPAGHRCLWCSDEPLVSASRPAWMVNAPFESGRLT